MTLESSTPAQDVGAPPLTQAEVETMLAERQFEALRRRLVRMNPFDTADLLEDIAPDQEVVTFRLLPKDLAVEVFEHLDVDQQRRLLEAFSLKSARDIMKGMSPDDRAALLDEVPAAVARKLLRLLPPKERQETVELLGYEEGTAGRVMTPDFVDLRENMTVAEALERIRAMALDKETIYYCYVVDNERRLRGTVSLRTVVISDPNLHIKDIATPDPKVALTTTDQEEAAGILQDYDLLAVPVVDLESRLVGIITWDDVADIMQEEVTEDIYRYGAVPGAEGRYFRARLFQVARQRVVWLFLLILVNTVTGSIIARQSDLLQEVVILAAFVPLLIGTGGNVGSQSSTVVIRGLATGEIEIREAFMILSRELVIGVLLGAMLGGVVVGWAYFLGRDLAVGLIVGGTLVAIATVAALVGGGLPFLFRKLRMDPAMVSAPFVSTIMDIVGVGLYFLIAHLVLEA